jgi:antitoxin component of MazEF toxin-antitoxin module
VTHTTEIQRDGDDYIIEIPQAILDELGWHEGTDLNLDIKYGVLILSARAEEHD